jgi:hypothetical protein
MDPDTFLAIWRGLTFTVEVEEKAWEFAVDQVQRYLEGTE